jgi:hypothetical protein
MVPSRSRCGPERRAREREAICMQGVEGNTRGYLLAAAVGAIGGSLAVLAASRAIPRIICPVMAGMMQQMISRMGEEGCSPAEI